MTVVLESTDTTILDGINSHLHGAHTQCQDGAPRVTLVCGLTAGWNEMTFEDDKPLCPICWDIHQCPVCLSDLTPY